MRDYIKNMLSGSINPEGGENKKSEFSDILFWESVVQSQKIGFWDSTDECPLTIGDFISDMIAGYSVEDILSLTVVHYDRSKERNDKTYVGSAEVCSLGLFRLLDLAEEDDSLSKEVVLVLRCKQGHCVLFLQEVLDCEYSRYARVTYLDASVTDVAENYVSAAKENRAFSFIVSHLKENYESFSQKYESVFTTAEKKLKKGDVLDKDEYELLRGIGQKPSNESFSLAHSYVDQKRFYDAYVTLKSFFPCLNELYIEDEDKYGEIYSEYTFLMGFCLMSMCCYEDAYYYFKLSMLEDEDFFVRFQMLIPLAKCGNILLLDEYFNEWIEERKLYYGSKEDWPEEVKDEYYFLTEEVLRILKSVKDTFCEVYDDDDELDGAVNTISIFDMGDMISIPDISILDMAYVYDVKSGKILDFISDVESINDFVLNDEDAVDKIIICFYSNAYFNVEVDSMQEADLSELCKSAPVVFVTKSLLNKDNEPVIGLNIIKGGYDLDSGVIVRRGDIVRPEQYSFIMNYEIDVKSDDLPSFATECIQYAYDCFSRKMYAEAYTVGLYVFYYYYNCCKSESGRSIEAFGDDIYEVIKECSFIVGSSLVEIGNNQKAYMYLELAKKDNNYPLYIKEYFNCLCNAVHPQALFEIIEQEELLKLMKNDGEIDEEALTDLLNFLERRKSFVLIEYGDYKEAAALLKKMKKNPVNAQYAAEELEYLKVLMKKNKG